MIIILHFDPISQDSFVRYPLLYLPVPLFFVISSYLFFRKDESKRNPVRFVKRNLKLYLVYFCLFLPYYLKEYIGLFDEGLWKGLLGFATKFFLGSTFRNSWFIISLVIGVLVVHYLSKLNNWLPILVGTLTYLLCMFETSFSNISQGTFIQQFLDVYPGHLVYGFPLATTWCALGYYSAVHKEKMTKVGGAVLLILTVLLYVEFFGYKTLGFSEHPVYCIAMIPLCYSIFLLIRDSDIHLSNPQWFRKSSTIIFCTHGVIGSLIAALITKLFGDATLFPLTTLIFLLLILTETLLVFIILKQEKRWKWLHNLY